MHGEELRRVLDQVTEEILDRMRREGFHVQYNVVTGEPMDELRHDPTVWDINNGCCEEWAELAADRIPGAFTVWIDPDVDHCVLCYDGKFYDADCPDGVDRWGQLPMFANPQLERPEP